MQKARELTQRAEQNLKLTGATLEIVKLLHEAHDLDPQLAEAQWMYGRCIVDLNMIDRIRDAKEFLLRAKASMATHPDPCVYLGRVYRILGDNESAEKSFREALRRDPRHNAAKKYLADL